MHTSSALSSAWTRSCLVAPWPLSSARGTAKRSCTTFPKEIRFAARQRVNGKHAERVAAPLEKLSRASSARSTKNGSPSEKWRSSRTEGARVAKGHRPQRAPSQLKEMACSRSHSMGLRPPLWKAKGHHRPNEWKSA
eukprot:scaffold148868_cov31-Tisochrysis_lutea.AAC.3